jgi:peroxiredoxin
MTAPWIAAFLTLWIVVSLVALLTLGVLRRVTPVLEQAENRLADLRAHPSGLHPGTTVPSFSVSELNGGTFTNSDLYGSTTIVLFVGAACRACERFVRDLRNNDVPDLGARLVAVTENAEEARELASASARAVIQEAQSLSLLFKSDRFPHVFVVDAKARVVASGWPNDWEGVRALVPSVREGGDRASEIAAAVQPGTTLTT